MNKYLINHSIFDPDIVEATRNFKPLTKIIEEWRHRDLCNRWINRLIENKNKR